MNILFVVPDDYTSVGGISLPVKNYTKQLNSLGNNVEIYPMPYHLKGELRNQTRVKLLEILKAKHIDTVMTFGLNLSYIMIDLVDDNDYKGQKVSYMVDSMRLFSVSRRKNAQKGETSIKDRVKECLYTFKERKCLKYYSKIVYVSNVDVRYVLDYYKVNKSKVFYVPNGTNIPSNFIGSQVSAPLKIGCLSGFSDTIVKDNLDPLVSIIFPEIQKRYPEMKLVIAGKGASKEYEAKMRANPSIVYLGFVETLDEFYEKVDVVLTTVKKECGIINRILEAWSYGKAVVGYDRNFWTFTDAENNLHYVSADSPSDFSDVITDIINNKIDITLIGKNAFELVKNNYTWVKCATLLNSILKK